MGRDLAWLSSVILPDRRTSAQPLLIMTSAVCSDCGLPMLRVKEARENYRLPNSHRKRSRSWAVVGSWKALACSTDQRVALLCFVFRDPCAAVVQIAMFYDGCLLSDLRASVVAQPASGGSHARYCQWL